MPGKRAFRRTLAAAAWQAPPGEPQVHYGEVLAPGRGLIHGGKVKLLHLAAEFPEQTPFNILYLVSSAPPPWAEELVRWAKLRGAKLVWNQNGVAFPAWATRRTGEINDPMRSLMQAADAVVYQSEFCRQSAEHWLGPVKVPAKVLLNPVDLAAFAPSATPPDPATWRLLAAGTHHEPERVLTAISTLAVLRERGCLAKLTLAGRCQWRGGEARVARAIQDARMDAHINRIPIFDQATAPALYQRHHLLLHPKYSDPCPTVPIEALACGLPVIASASGGMPELVDDASGRLLKVPLDWERAHYPAPAAMADAIASIMADWSTHSRGARARAERLFDHRLWVKRHREIFEAVLR